MLTYYCRGVYTKEKNRRGEEKRRREKEKGKERRKENKIYKEEYNDTTLVDSLEERTGGRASCWNLIPI